MSRKKVIVLYGSQTGQAEAIATDIHEDGVFRNYDVQLFCLKDEEKLFNITEVECAIVICSTTGEGDPPENARKFIRTLNRKTLPDNYLSSLHYALLGLGDTNYSTFCGGPKKLEKAFKRCGANSFYNTAFADDATDMEDTIEPWLDGLWEAVEVYFNSSKNFQQEKVRDGGDSEVIGGLDNASETIPIHEHLDANSSDINDQSRAIESMEKRLLEINITQKEGMSEPYLGKGSDDLTEVPLTLPPVFPIYLQVKFLDSEFQSPESNQTRLKFPVQNGDVIQAKIASMQQLTSDDALKRTLEFTLSSDEMFPFQPGDSFAICCENDDKEVDWLIERLSLQDVADKPAQLYVSDNFPKKSTPAHFASPFTIRQAFKSHLEIRAVPKKTFLSALSKCTGDTKEQHRLQELVSKQGGTEYTKFVRESSVCLLDILATFPSCKPDFCLLAQHLPRLMPRRYSVACSPHTDPCKVRFVFNVTRFAQNRDRTYVRNGVCTGMLERIFDLKNQNNSDVFLNIFPTKNMGFCLPQDPGFPIVMIGPGTGVAPFVGFLEHRIKNKSPTQAKLGAAWLFYGCRHENQDFLYKETFEKFKADKVLTNFRVAFSRNDAKPFPKYVQDSLKMHSDKIVSLLLSTNAIFYICGDARNMAKDVRQSFLEMIAEHTSCTNDEALVKFKEVVSQKRYLEDIWT